MRFGDGESFTYLCNSCPSPSIEGTFFCLFMPKFPMICFSVHFTLTEYCSIIFEFITPSLFHYNNMKIQCYDMA